MAIKIGTTAITSVGKIKLGTTNITKVYQGTTQIFPVVSLGTLNFLFVKDSTCGIASLYINSVVVSTLSSTGNFSTTLNTGDTFYVIVTLTGQVCGDYSSNIYISSTTRGILHNSDVQGTQLSPTITKIPGENITINTSTSF